MSDYKFWIIENEMCIYWLKLNRLEKMNSFSAQVAEELDLILQEFKKNENIQILIISSNSDEFFSAGADIDWFQEIGGPEAQEISERSDSFPESEPSEYLGQFRRY